MVCNYLIYVSHTLHSVVNAYANVVNTILTFVDTTPTTNIITNETILAQYNIIQLLKVFVKKVKAAVWKLLQQFCDRIFFDPNKPRDLTY